VFYLTIYVSIGLLSFVIYRLSGKISDVAPERKLQTCVIQAFAFAALWPVIIGVVEWNRLEAIKQLFKHKKISRLETLLTVSLRQPNINASKIDDILMALVRLNPGIAYNEDIASCSKFWVERYKDTEHVLQVHHDELTLGYTLFGEDYLSIKLKEENTTKAVREETVGDRHFYHRDTISLRVADPRGEPWLSIFTHEFKKSISKVDKKVKGRIVEAIMEICEAPLEMKGDTQKPLVGEFDGHWRYRIGDYRLIYLPMIDHHKIIFSDFDTRGQIYQ